jgi:hypothetical protein
MGGFLHYTPAVAKLLVATTIDNTPKTLDNTNKNPSSSRVPSLSREQNYEAQQIEPIPLVPWPISTNEIFLNIHYNPSDFFLIWKNNNF